jgi:hypothetical protein
VNDSAFNERDRREFFRVEDSVRLNVKTCPTNTSDSGICAKLFDQSSTKLLVQELRKIDHDNSQLLRVIGEQDRNLELYLKSINRKLELIATELCASVEDTSSQRQSVVISEAGMDFLSREIYAPGQMLALELTLFPSRQTLYLLGEVLSCQQGPIKHRIGLAFKALNAIDQQSLAKQVMQCQLQHKREQKEQQA